MGLVSTQMCTSLLLSFIVSVFSSVEIARVILHPITMILSAILVAVPVAVLYWSAETRHSYPMNYILLAIITLAQTSIVC